MHRRHVRLVLAQRGQSVQGTALRARLGARAGAHGRSTPAASPSRPRPRPVRRRTNPGGAPHNRTLPTLDSRPGRRWHERRQVAGRHHPRHRLACHGQTLAPADLRPSGVHRQKRLPPLRWVGRGRPRRPPAGALPRHRRRAPWRHRVGAHSRPCAKTPRPGRSPDGLPPRRFRTQGGVREPRGVGTVAEPVRRPGRRRALPHGPGGFSLRRSRGGSEPEGTWMTAAEGVFELVYPLPDLERPRLLIALQPWIDVGSVGTMALGYLVQHWDAQEIGRVRRPGVFYGFSRYRPMLYRPEGERQLAVPNNFPPHAKSPTGQEWLFVHALEPPSHGEDYVEAVLGLIRQFGVRQDTLIRSLYAPRPHTRPPVA